MNLSILHYFVFVDQIRNEIQCHSVGLLLGPVNHFMEVEDRDEAGGGLLAEASINK